MKTTENTKNIEENFDLLAIQRLAQLLKYTGIFRILGATSFEFDIQNYYKKVVSCKRQFTN